MKLLAATTRYYLLLAAGLFALASGLLHGRLLADQRALALRESAHVAAPQTRLPVVDLLGRVELRTVSQRQRRRRRTTIANCELRLSAVCSALAFLASASCLRSARASFCTM